MRVKLILLAQFLIVAGISTDCVTAAGEPCSNLVCRFYDLGESDDGSMDGSHLYYAFRYLDNNCDNYEFILYQADDGYYPGWCDEDVCTNCAALPAPKMLKTPQPKKFPYDIDPFKDHTSSAVITKINKPEAYKGGSIKTIGSPHVYQLTDASGRSHYVVIVRREIERKDKKTGKMEYVDFLIGVEFAVGAIMAPDDATDFKGKIEVAQFTQQGGAQVAGKKCVCLKTRSGPAFVYVQNSDDWAR